MDVSHMTKLVQILKDTEDTSINQELDSIVLSVIDKFKKRAKLGKEKYGTDLDREDLKVLDWINHAQEELMDGILYLEKLKKSMG
jgi:hypothetical protein